MRTTQGFPELSIPSFCLGEALLQLPDSGIEIVEFELLLVTVVLYILDQLLQVYVFCILVDEVLLSAFEIASQFKFLLGCFNLTLFTPIVVFL